jgi:hypothetical protein
MLLLAGVALALTSPALAQDIGGDYTVEGTNLNGSSYGGAGGDQGYPVV